MEGMQVLQEVVKDFMLEVLAQELPGVEVG